MEKHGSDAFNLLEIYSIEFQFLGLMMNIFSFKLECVFGVLQRLPFMFSLFGKILCSLHNPMTIRRVGCMDHIQPSCS